MSDRIERLKSAVKAQRFSGKAFTAGFIWAVRGLAAWPRALWILGSVFAGFLLDAVSASFNIPWFVWFLYFATICVALALRTYRDGISRRSIPVRVRGSNRRVPSSLPDGAGGSLVLGATTVSILMTVVVAWFFVDTIGLVLAAVFWGSVLRRIFGNRKITQVPQVPTTIKRGASSHYNADGSSKVTYFTQSDATDAVRMFEEDHPGESMNAYLCGQCSKWHIGHAR